MHEYHAVILLLSKPGHPIWVLSLDILAGPAPGPSSHVPKGSGELVLKGTKFQFRKMKTFWR